MAEDVEIAASGIDAPAHEGTAFASRIGDWLNDFAFLNFNAGSFWSTFVVEVVGKLALLDLPGAGSFGRLNFGRGLFIWLHIASGQDRGNAKDAG